MTAQRQIEFSTSENAGSQRTQIINHLMTKGPLTVLTAIKFIGCYALSQRCGELRREGFPVQSKWVELDNGKKVKQYYLEP
jgi:hypothetical protein